MTDLENTAEPTIRSAFNRRTVLKGAVAGTALWAVPSITTLGTRALAASGSVTCGPGGHDGYPGCAPGDTFNQCGNEGVNSYCFCDQDTSGNEGCFADFFCDDPQATPCSSNADCKAGLLCTTNNCGTVCSPCCGAPVAPTSTHKYSKTASGKVA